MRQIKFRAWDDKFKRFHYWGVELMGEGTFTGSPSPVYPNQQFTGLFDKNGKEIYEGDICRTYKYKSDDKGWCRLSEDNKEYFNIVIKYEEKTPFCGFVIQKWYEVIGNIYENPELLND